MRTMYHTLRILIPLIILAAVVVPAGAKQAAFSTGFIRWRAADHGFTGWTLSGAAIGGAGELRLDQATSVDETDPYPTGGYYGGNFYTGGSYLVGEATSPEVTAPFAYKEAIASWNATTPTGTWIETLIRARFGERWTKWYNLGIWVENYSTIQRHSVRSQGDSDGYVAVDTLVLTNKKETTNTFQIKFRLFSVDGTEIPTIENASVAYSTSAVKSPALTPGDPGRWNQLLAVPECSQMVYLDGGEVWCSPTSTSMVVAYWKGYSGPCEPRVRAAVEGVYDWIYDGHGNWPFNTAYAAALGLEGYVARFTNLAQAEEWVTAGVPVIVSFAWKKSDLSGAPIPSSGGHLAVLVGFDAAGNPIINDPAAASDADVQRIYQREEFEPLWLKNSGGTVYLIYPPGWAVPTIP